MNGNFRCAACNLPHWTRQQADNCECKHPSGQSIKALEAKLEQVRSDRDRLADIIAKDACRKALVDLVAAWDGEGDGLLGEPFETAKKALAATEPLKPSRTIEDALPR
jgi:hypothetical protein